MDKSMMDKNESQEAFDRLLGELRPKLHRYCARMTGSVVDGEDVVQETIVKALEALAETGPIADPAGWLFRIAHNAALDFLRRRARENAAHVNEDLDMIVDPLSVADARQIAAASLQTFMRLPVAQRSSVILMDVLGYSLEEVSEVMGTSVLSVKGSLYRGRTRLREIADEPDDRRVPVLTEPERSLLTAYIERFNARDFDAIRSMLADEVRLDLVNNVRWKGRLQVSKYFHNYSTKDDWRLTLGRVEGRPAILVRDPSDISGKTAYFMLLEWSGSGLVSIQDFRYARYVMDGAEILSVS
jgi:RNA polymerase sigma-70 factor (ECF subfamily)